MSSNPVTPQNRRRSHRSSTGPSTSSPAIIPIDANNLPFESQAMLAKFARLADGVEELKSHVTSMEKVHQSVSQEFNEGLASLLYGLSMTMWCVGFSGGPTKVNIEKFQQRIERAKKIAQLKKRLANSQRLNSNLKAQLQEVKQKQPVPRNTRVVSKPRPAPVKQTRIQILDRSKASEVPSSNDSTFITNPSQSKRTTTTQPVRSPSYKRPNLNQPSRYLAGLFGGTSNRESVRKQPNKPRFAK
ncbi:uncharacterized protein SPAPADRAFT_52180 [Spathaspora passalidarum NRRL Y-27907]|uniref:DASH complex subunit DAM1 n=1 Tax=Spathaspora passalidarum (strain NRRL Y-27907 / 11-Y1) TaxID=619300 RepID=G3ATN1_SPAPN|nr:uncharacterized protein SPAPADRAFT_52180 [Spathaspora passalidarum NRRL Y-27907]EGW30995.1 hypothetical protein SPAPADRAFT_52180 [Spathaspora passalidarum NRRL Y-27907]